MSRSQASSFQGGFLLGFALSFPAHSLHFRIKRPVVVNVLHQKSRRAGLLTRIRNGREQAQSAETQQGRPELVLGQRVHRTPRHRDTARAVRERVPAINLVHQKRARRQTSSVPNPKFSDNDGSDVRARSADDVLDRRWDGRIGDEETGNRLCHLQIVRGKAGGGPPARWKLGRSGRTPREVLVAHQGCQQVRGLLEVNLYVFALLER